MDRIFQTLVLKNRNSRNFFGGHKCIDAVVAQWTQTVGKRLNTLGRVSPWCCLRRARTRSRTPCGPAGVGLRVRHTCAPPVLPASPALAEPGFLSFELANGCCLVCRRSLSMSVQTWRPLECLRRFSALRVHAPPLPLSASLRAIVLDRAQQGAALGLFGLTVVPTPCSCSGAPSMLALQSGIDQRCVARFARSRGNARGCMHFQVETPRGLCYLDHDYSL